MALKFSQRIGKTPVKNSLQSKGMDAELRACLWNCVDIAFLTELCSFPESVSVQFFKRIWHEFFKWPIDTISQRIENNIGHVRKWFFDADWHQVYDFVEFLAYEPHEANDSGFLFLFNQGSFSQCCNGILEREMSAYRIVNSQVMQITDEQEIEAIETAVSQKGPWVVVGAHLTRCSALLFDRKGPNYPNAVKEAISSVESACCVVTGKKGASLGQALKEVEKAYPLHGALKEAFSNLYGYTSDAGGIRHGSIDMAKVTFEEAKYMLVACSAFVNYLKGISAKGV